MYYPENVIEEVRMSNDIVDVISQYVNLTQRGNSYFGLCPFHNESTPSFSVSADKQLYHCFGCGASGNVFSFVMQRENYDFPDAVKFLADRIHYTLPEGKNAENARRLSHLKNNIYDIHTAAARYYYNKLTDEVIGKEARAYLDRRDIGVNVRRKFGLGFAPESWEGLYKYLMEEGFDLDAVSQSGLVLSDKRGGYRDRFRNRLMFPIFNVQNKVIGFGGRIISSGEPKYLNSPETPIFEKSKNLYSLNFARASGKRDLILVEGYMDVISLYQAGIPNVAAALGTAFNLEHVKVLKKYADTVYILFDSDEAGRKAALRAIPYLYEGGLKIKVIILPGAKDPDEYIQKFGYDRFMTEKENSLSHIAFQIKVLSEKYDLEDISQKIDFTKEVSKILSKLDSQIEADVYIQEASGITGISSAAIQSEINKLRGENQLKDMKKKQSSFVSQNKLKEKGLMDARKGIIFTAAMNKDISDKIAQNISPEEMGQDVFEKLLDIIFKAHNTGNHIYPAELANYFEDPGEHKIVSEIFMTALEQRDIHLLLRAVSDQIKIVKKAYIDEKLARMTDMAEIQNLLDIKRNIEKLNITVGEG